MSEREEGIAHHSQLATHQENRGQKGLQNDVVVFISATAKHKLTCE